jgi:hypothetical protein
MMNHRLRCAAIAVIVSLCCLVQVAGAEGMDTVVASAPTAPALAPAAPAIAPFGLRLSGFLSLEFGQLENTWMTSCVVPQQDVMRTYVNFGISKDVTNRLHLEAALEAQMYYNTFNQTEKSGVEAFFLPTQYYNFYIDRAYGNFFLGDAASPFLQLMLGYFPFKYNNDARDLGEYLYRSGTYPAYLVNNFDYAKARLLGLKVTSDLGNWFHVHQDLLATVGSEYPPFFDLNLGYIVTFDFGKIFNLGLGGMYQSLVPAVDEITTPNTSDNWYLTHVKTDTLGGLISGDTLDYTSAGLKLMARFTFDPKRIFHPSPDFRVLGIEDLKLYGEMAILGVKDYPVSTPWSQANVYGYDTLLHKMPIMLGFNVPAFKVCDVLTVEAEWYGCTYPNNFEYKSQLQYVPDPVPNGQINLPEHNYAYLDNWKWAVYAKKSFKNGLFIVGQVACDHIRNATPLAIFVDEEEALRTDKSWWWVLKLGYQF